MNRLDHMAMDQIWPIIRFYYRTVKTTVVFVNIILFIKSKQFYLYAANPVQLSFIYTASI